MPTAGLAAALPAGPGPAGYFLGWNLDGSGGQRLSTANRYPEEALAPQLEKNSENPWWLQAEGGLGWLLPERLHLVASGEASWRRSYDPGERRWIGRVGAAVEYSF